MSIVWWRHFGPYVMVVAERAGELGSCVLLGACPANATCEVSRTAPREFAAIDGLTHGPTLPMIAAAMASVDSDLALYEAWRAGDTRAGGRLIDRHLAGLGRFFANKVARQQDVHDLVAETFEGCIKGLERFRAESSFRGYLFGIAHNVLRGYIRSKRRHPDKFDFSEVSVCDLGPSPSELLAHRREQKLLLGALRALPLDYQIVLELTYFEDMTRDEVAEVIACPPGTVASRVRKGRALLLAAVGRLASSPELLQTTTTDLDGWARSLRACLFGSEPRDGRG